MEKIKVLECERKFPDETSGTKAKIHRYSTESNGILEGFEPLEPGEYEGTIKPNGEYNSTFLPKKKGGGGYGAKSMLTDKQVALQCSVEFMCSGKLLNGIDKNGEGETLTNGQLIKRTFDSFTKWLGE